MTTNALSMPRSHAAQSRGWPLLQRGPRKVRDRGARAEVIHRRQQDARAARRDLERQWGALMLERPLLNV